MGQCSTLPAEGRGSSSVASRHEGVPFNRAQDANKRLGLDFNNLVANENEARATMAANDKATKERISRSYVQNHKVESFQERDPDQTMETTTDEDGDMMEVDRREEVTTPIPPPPPENATKVRCYKLNLDSEIIGLTGSRSSLFLGPFEDEIPPLTYSSSSDGSENISERQVAIQTAQIFRGITVGRDGTILGQNARATRSNRGNKTKKGEKSRQAAKIDKAKDLVEESIATGKAPDSDEPAVMQSLYPVGEYDDMKYLVRDGSKKLREAKDLPDDALLSINRMRPGAKKNTPPASSPRKRSSPSPNFVNGQRNAAMQAPEKVHITGTMGSQSLTSSVPPKLKGHPRDTRSGRREDRSRVRLDSCSDFMDPRRGGMQPGDADWNAWNLWNCGGGTVSPVHPSTPTDARNYQPTYEGRDSSYAVVRESGETHRAN